VQVRIRRPGLRRLGAIAVTRTHFAYRIDLWDASGDNIVEHLAGVEDYELALATEAIAECIRSGSVGEAESNIGLLCLVPTPATSHWDVPFTVEGVKF